MNSNNHRRIAALLWMAVMLGACSKSEEKSSEPPTANAPAVATTAAPETKVEKPKEPLSTESRQGIDRLLDAYEQIRAKLAKDDIAGVTEDAETLAKAAGAAASKAPQKLHTHLQAIASATRSLKEMSKEDPKAVRRAFGDISKSVVVLLAAQPSLQQGRHVFQCPMAEGYKKWVQPTAELSNPYMGTRMSSCGSATDWAEGG